MIAPRYNSIASSIRVGFLAALLNAGIAMVLTENPILIVFGIFVIGAMFAHAVELQHQCLHFSAFHSRRINKTVGILLGLPTLTSFHAYRRSHLEHHRNLGALNDTPFFKYRFMDRPTIGSLLYDLFGISHIKASLSAIFGSGDSRLIRVPEGEEPNNISERFDYGLMGFLLVCATFMALAFGPIVVLKVWILPLLLVAQHLHFLIELPEHIGCDEGMEYSIMEIARLLIRSIKRFNLEDESVSAWIQFVEDRPFNDKRYYISNSKLKALGWRIRVNFEDGIRNLIS